MSSIQKRRGISIYPATDAPDLAETDYMQVHEEVPLPLQEVMQDEGAKTSSTAKVLVRDASGFSLLYLWFKANFPIPRHSHDTDCIYYVISGSAVMGNRTLRAGDSFFAPAHAPYQYAAGPDGVEVLEIRYGVEHFELNFHEDPEHYRQVVAEAIAANREVWAEAPVSPTLMANAG